MIISPQSNGRYLIPYNIWHVAQMIPGFLTFCSPINIEYLRTKKHHFNSYRVWESMEKHQYKYIVCANFSHDPNYMCKSLTMNK